METSDAREEFSRSPTVDDLVVLCRHLNEAGAEYVVIGGFALIHHGYVRTTGDIDLLVESSPKNIERVKEALLQLPDRAVKHVSPEDIDRYAVVRVADEIVVDLMGKACGLSYTDLKKEMEFEIIRGVRIPFLNARGLLQTKQSLRPQDVQDRMFLEELMRRES